MGTVLGNTQRRALDSMHFASTKDCYCLDSLTPSGRMLVEAMRHAPAGAAATLACFVEVRGEPHGRPCFVVFLQVVHGLALYGRRRMRVGAVRWPILTHDEVAFLRCVDAGLQHDEAALTAHVTWLVRKHGARDFKTYVRTLASLIREPVFADPPAPYAQNGADRPAAKRPARNHAAPAFPVAVK